MEPAPTASADVVVISPQGGLLAWEALKKNLRTTARGYHQQWWQGVVFYHRNGRKYQVDRVTPDRQLGTLSKLLAATVYNPWLETGLEYEDTGSYVIADLCAAVRKAIEMDDDVLTQFHDETELIAVLGNVGNFDEILDLLRFMETP